MSIKGACAVVIVAVLGFSSHVHAQEPARRGKWWESPAMQSSLHLTRDQVTKIEDIFQSTLPERQALRQQLDALEHQAEGVLSQATVDDTAAMRLIERVEAVRAQRNTARTLLLYRIRRVLTPEQRRWFDNRK